MNVGELRALLANPHLPDTAGIVIDFLDSVSPLGVICHCTDAFAIGTATDDPGLVLRANPVPR